jgi:uncharacterized protein YbjT (DUF2867 family)
MRVLMTGAYGLIGSASLARLHRDGHDLVGAGRPAFLDVIAIFALMTFKPWLW